MAGGALRIQRRVVEHDVCTRGIVHDAVDVLVLGEEGGGSGGEREVDWVAGVAGEVQELVEG